MSAPRTNIEKQRRRHVGPLVGLTIILVAVSLLFFGYMAYHADTDETPEPQIQTDDPSVLPSPSTPATPLDGSSPNPSLIAPAPAPEPVQ